MDLPHNALNPPINFGSKLAQHLALKSCWKCKCVGNVLTERSEIMAYQEESNTFEILPGRLTTPRSEFVTAGIYTDEDC